MDLQCPNCDTIFSVPDSLAGGMTNCPKCNTLMEIGGTPDAGIFWGCMIAAAICLLLLVALCIIGGAVEVGIIVLIFGAIILGIAVFAS